MSGINARPGDIPHSKPSFGEREVQAVVAALRSGQWSGGPRVSELESLLAGRAGVAHAIGVGSGLGALRLALLGLGVEPGDHVLVPAYSCVALPNAVLACRAKPIPVDVTRGSWSISPEKAQEACAAFQPKAIIVVNMFGLPAPMNGFEGNGLFVIEDCAHAFGVRADHRHCGARGDAAIMSFHATKLLAAGEGGAVLTDSETLAHSVRNFREYANKPPHGNRLNDKMTDLAAALALCQLERLDEMIAERRRLARRYTECLGPVAAQTGAFLLPEWRPGHIWYRYVLELTQRSAAGVVESMREQGILTVKPVEDWRGLGDPPCPVADRAYDRIVSLPIYPSLTEEAQTRVIAGLEQACTRRGLR